VDRAIDFYSKTFGWDIKKYTPDNPKDMEKMGMDYWLIMTGSEKMPGINGGLYKRLPDRKLYTFDCTIEVEDIDQAIADVRKNGGMIETGKMELMNVGWFARAKDTEGNMFGLMQPTNKNIIM